MGEALFSVLIFWLVLLGFVGSLLVFAWGLDRLDR